MTPAKILPFALFLALFVWVEAFPPAPHHQIYGVVKNEQGTPLSTGDATLILTGPDGEVMRAPVDTALAPGLNYRLQVPQDSGITFELYNPTALFPSSAYSIWVDMNGQVYLPIEMQGDLQQLGESGASTRLDLTLGIDSDGDGLPDAWEQNIIDFDLNDALEQLGDIRPGDDIDGDGMKNYAEYIAGTYAFDEIDALRIEVKEIVNGVARLEFVTITGHTYTLSILKDGEKWVDQPFSLDPSGLDTSAYLLADTVTLLSVYVDVGSDPSALFQLKVE